mgnify:CR=1 FL=1
MSSSPAASNCTRGGSRGTRSGTRSSPRHHATPVPPHVDVGNNANGTPLSSVTRPSTDVQRRLEVAIDADPAINVGVDSPVSPVRRLEAFTMDDLEEMYDFRAYNDNAGASDSEDEDEDAAAFRMMRQANLEHSLYAEDSLAAVSDDCDFHATIVDEPPAAQEQPMLYGAPIGWKFPQPPDSWKAWKVDTEKGEPSFKDVDNPGEWPEFTFKAKFAMQ